MRSVARMVLTVTVALSLTTNAAACNIPVFRYALENWLPDPYHVLIVTRKPLSQEDEELVQRLVSASRQDDRPANLNVVQVVVSSSGTATGSSDVDSSDVGTDETGPDESGTDESGTDESETASAEFAPTEKDPTEKDLADTDTVETSELSTEEAEGGDIEVTQSGEGELLPEWVLNRLKSRLVELADDEPTMCVLYPKTWDRFAWVANLSGENVAKLIDSPVRQTIANRLLDGQSAVWVLLDGADAEQNDVAWELLNQELTRIQGTVELPARELIVAEDQYREDLEEKIELRVEFSALRISRDNEAEAAFASLLLGSEADLVEFADQPIAIPVYGRARTYFALVGKGINAETIEANGKFICGACSCEVKRDNPGIDLLLAMNWDAKIGGSAMPDIVLPELTGIGGLEMAVTAAGDSARDGTPDSSVSDATVDASLANSTADADSVTLEESHVNASASTATLAEPIAAVEPTAEATPQDQVAMNTHAAIASEEPASPLYDPAPSSSRELTASHTDESEASKPFEMRLLLTVLSGVGIAVGVLGLIAFWLERKN